MTHAEMNESYELYALGVLDREVAVEIDKHLDEQCAYCMEHILEAVKLTSSISSLAEPVRPSSGLRERVLASIRPPKRSWEWTFMAGLSTASAALLVLFLWSTSQMSRLRDQASALRVERNELRSAVQMLSRSDTRTVQFGKAENVPHGRVLVNSGGGLVFVGSRLPALARDRTFELWIIPRSGAPKPAGLFRPDSAGDTVGISSLPVGGEAKAVAVSVEPSAGSNAPTTTPILMVPLG